MKKINLALSIATLFSMVTISGCDEKNSSSNRQLVEHTLSVLANEERRLNNVTIEIYNKEELVDTVVTNYIGNAAIEIYEGTYTVTLSNLPAGVHAEDSYSLSVSGTGKKTVLNCFTQIIDAEVPENNKYSLGSVMYDFTMTDTEGNNHTLSEIFETKELVVLNFWYIDCYWCEYEFPFLAEAYPSYEEDLEILALNINPNDTLTGISEYKESYSLPFPVGKDSTGIFDMFGFTGAPTTVLINKYGVVTYVHSGAFQDYDTVCYIFDEYL